MQLEFGDVDGALAASDVVAGGEYWFEGTTHAALEPHCAIGVWEPQGVLTVYSTTQVAHYLHRELARVLDLPADRIRVIQPPLGGGFGGKSEPFDLEFCVAKLAMIAGRPAKLLNSREEVFYAHRGRHPMRLRVRLGATRDGRLTGCDLNALIDGGAYASFGLVTTYYAGSGAQAWFYMKVNWYVESEGKQFTFSGIRTTGVLEKENDLWQIVQLHTSMPVTGEAVRY